MGRRKDVIEYYVSVGANGLGHETRCETLEEAKRLYNSLKDCEKDEITLHKCNYTNYNETIVNHRKAR